MKIKVLYGCLAALLLYACGSRKTEVDKSESKTEIATDLNLKTDLKSDSNLNIEFDVLRKALTIKPVDNNKPMVVDGKSYTNAVLTNETTKDNTKVAKLEKVSKIEEKQAKTTSVKAVSKKIKTSDRNATVFSFMILISSAFILFVLYKKNRS